MKSFGCGFVLSVAMAAIIGPAMVGHAACPSNAPVDCGTFCCPANNTCNPVHPGGACCPANTPVACQNTCCAAGEVCSADGSTCGASCPAGSPVDCGNGFCCGAGDTCNRLHPGLCCDQQHPVACQNTCCPAGQLCSADGNSCGTSCPANAPVDCGTFCCAAGNTCNLVHPGGGCCDAADPVACQNGCCPANNTCNSLNPSLCCAPGSPVSCQNTCCPTGSQCSSDGATCVGSAACSVAGFPVDCHDGACCPAGDRCGSAPIHGGDVLYPACCVDLPQVPSPSTRRFAETLGGATANAAKKSGGSKCPKSSKHRPFEVLQVTAGSNGAPASFDITGHEYSLAFALNGKSGQGVVLKVPLVQEDSSATMLSVRVPPFVLSNKTHGKAAVFVITDGVMGTDCVAAVRITPLPKSPSRIRGLATLSWLRANQKVYTAAKPMLTSPSAAPFVNPAILGDVDTAMTSVGKLLPSFTKGTMPKDVAKTAKYSDTLVAGMLTAAQNVSDPPFASAAHALMQAIAKAKDGSDASLAAAETTYANTLLNPSGPGAQSTAKFTVGCGAVTNACVGASATMVAGGSTRASGIIDAQASATVMCGATANATAAVAGVATLAAGAATSNTSTSAYGKTLLTGSARAAMHTQIDYGHINLATAKLCGCPEPTVQGVITISITIVVSCEHLRSNAPTFCLPDTPPSMTGGSGSCGNGTIDTGEECDPNAHPTGCSAGKTCESCRCVGTGDVRVTLTWSTPDDLDLHVVDPTGTEIYYGNRTSSSGGMLDVDSNAGCATTQTNPVENIFWGTGAAPRGTYTVKVDYFRHCGSGAQTVPFTVKTVVDGNQNSFPGNVSTADGCGACSGSGCRCTTVTTFSR